MENATKALLIAGGVLFAMMIVVLLIIGYNSISDYYQEKDKNESIKSITKFNREYSSYNRENVRGSDLLTLLNKIVDYNDRDADPGGDELYEPILIKVKITDYPINSSEGKNVINKFKYTNKKVETYLNQYFKTNADLDLIKSQYINYNINGSLKEYDERKDNCDLITCASNDAKTLLSGQDLKSDDTTLRKLSKEIANIFAVREYTTGTDDEREALKVRTKILKEIFGEEITETDKILAIEQAAYEYYQLTQFKRANFDCENMEYNENTGRIIEFEFVFTGKFS